MLPDTLLPLLVWGVVMLFGYTLGRLGHRGTPEYERQQAHDAQSETRRWIAYAWQLSDLLRTHAPGVSIPPSPLRETNGASGQRSLTWGERSRWRHLLTERMNFDELCNLAFDLGFDADGITRPGDLARRLIEYLEDREQTQYLLHWLTERRPDIKP